LDQKYTTAPPNLISGYPTGFRQMSFLPWIKTERCQYLVSCRQRPSTDGANETEEMVGVMSCPHHHLIRPQTLTTSTTFDTVTSEKQNGHPLNDVTEREIWTIVHFYYVRLCIVIMKVSYGLVLSLLISVILNLSKVKRRQRFNGRDHLAVQTVMLNINQNIRQSNKRERSPLNYDICCLEKRKSINN
jgi:hypothetical protein